MPPSGPRSRPSQPPPSSSARPPNATVRNEMFENIFGRPAVGHHQTTGLAIPSASSSASGSSQQGCYGYAGYPSSANVNPYHNHAQPSFPPPQPTQSHAQYQSYAALPPPRTVSHVYSQQPPFIQQPFPEQGYPQRPGYENGSYGRSSVPQDHSGALAQVRDTLGG